MRTTLSSRVAPVRLQKLEFHNIMLDMTIIGLVPKRTIGNNIIIAESGKVRCYIIITKAFQSSLVGRYL